MAASSAQVAPAQEAGRPQPQTTIEPPGGPFIRHTQPGRRIGYQQVGQAFGAQISQPLVAAPGYARGFRLRMAATGGVGGGNTVAAAADAPFSAISLITLRDAFGTPLLVGPGYEILKLVPKYGGQFGLGALSDVSNLPSFSAVAVGAGASGNFVFNSFLPLELAKGYGVVSMANASLLPSLSVQLAASAAVYTTAPATTLPVMELDVDTDFYWLPEGTDVQPPGLGTTCQWVLQSLNPTIGSNSSTVISLPRLGGFITTIILIFRDSTGARTDAMLPTGRIRMTVDGVPLLDTRVDQLEDDMQIQMGGATAGWTRDTGVLAISRKTSLSQVSHGLLDTGEHFLSTNPGTLIQFEGSPWGTFGNSPGSVSALIGQVVPSGSIIQGLPEL